MSIAENAKGLTLNYPTITKYLDPNDPTNTTQITSIFNIACNSEINKVESVNITTVGTSTTYTFSAQSNAGCWF